jgi:UDP-glucose 4-epimerase
MSSKLNLGRIFITGGAGFIGSHLVDALCKNHEVVVLDNLSSGKLENVKKWLKSSNFTFVKDDLLKSEKIREYLSDCETIFHLAANPEVRVGSTNPIIHYEQNVAATFNLLEAIRQTGNVKRLMFTSSSTVYGEPQKIPTPENYAPLKPISVYGASKLASEALIISYAYTYGFDTIIYRLANIVGSRMQHGVIYDFINKLRKNSEKLEILGDGSQTKSYLDIKDCIKAMFTSLQTPTNRVEIYNVGSEDQVNVKQIASIICEEMGLENVEYVFTGGVDGGRGWKGDVKTMQLDVGKLKKLGWKPTLNSYQAVRNAARTLLHVR